MTFGEFQAIVGALSLLISDSDYNKIFKEYSKSELHKTEFFYKWRDNKKFNLDNCPPPQINRAALFCRAI